MVCEREEAKDSTDNKVKLHGTRQVSCGRTDRFCVAFGTGSPVFASEKRVHVAKGDTRAQTSQKVAKVEPEVKAVSKPFWTL